MNKRNLTREERAQQSLRILYLASILMWAMILIAFLFVDRPRDRAAEPEEPQPSQVEVEHKVEPAPVEPSLVREDVPLDEDVQELLYRVCEELGVPYELALAILQQETDFRNIVGDGGESFGYMQVQPRWHGDRMERNGVTDLMDPYGNFLVGCDYLAELIGKDRGLEWALMAYNGGPSYANKMAKAGKISQYAKNVLNYMNELKMEAM